VSSRSRPNSADVGRDRGSKRSNRYAVGGRAKVDIGRPGKEKRAGGLAGSRGRLDDRDQRTRGVANDRPAFPGAGHLPDLALAQSPVRGFKRRIARWIMHRTTGRITFGRRYWIVERFRWSARARRHEDFLFVETCLTRSTLLCAAQRAGVHAPTHSVTSSDHSFLFKASAVLLAASFRAAFASPVAF
jgi:hypothetical protein